MRSFDTFRIFFTALVCLFACVTAKPKLMNVRAFMPAEAVPKPAEAVPKPAEAEAEAEAEAVPKPTRGPPKIAGPPSPVPTTGKLTDLHAELDDNVNAKLESIIETHLETQLELDSKLESKPDVRTEADVKPEPEAKPEDYEPATTQPAVVVPDATNVATPETTQPQEIGV